MLNTRIIMIILLGLSAIFSCLFLFIVELNAAMAITFGFLCVLIGGLLSPELMKISKRLYLMK